MLYRNKYSKIKFYELKRLKKQEKKLIENNLNEIEKEQNYQEKLDIIRKKMIYVNYFPKDEKYLSILKQIDSPKLQKK